jgi:hypothetical protein
VFRAKKFLPNKFSEFLYQPSEGTSTGLLIAWNPKDYSITLIDGRKHAITLQINSNSDDTSYVLTNIYAPCDQHDITIFFAEIKQLKDNISLPWVLAGDFNIYRYVHEKNNANINWAAMDEFNAWINEMELMDIEISNSCFTWSNKRREPTLVKLDRVLVNVNWSQKFLHSELRSLLRPTSDHKNVILDTAYSTFQPRIFWFEDYWLTNVELVTITKNRLQRGTRHMSIETKINYRLRAIRAAIRAWLKEDRKKKSITEKFRLNTCHVIQYFDAVEEWRNLTDYEFALRLVCLDKIKNLNSIQAQHWRRRAKIKWCVLGDENTSFFHTMATYRFRKNKIQVLYQDQEEFFDDTTKLDIATNYFRNLFKEDRNCIQNIDLQHLYGQNTENLQNLEAPFTWQEIINAIKSAPTGRSPEPDGFTNEFYKFYCQDLKHELIQLFDALHSKAIQLQCLNLASIALLPKNESAKEMKDYRPISLQHSIPKLIAKVLANRLQPKIKSLVDEMQSGFLKGRSVIDNFSTAIEMIKCCNRLKRTIIILKLDFQKVFDSIDTSQTYL